MYLVPAFRQDAILAHLMRLEMETSAILVIPAIRIRLQKVDNAIPVILVLRIRLQKLDNAILAILAIRISGEMGETLLVEGALSLRPVWKH